MRLIAIVVILAALATGPPGCTCFTSSRPGAGEGNGAEEESSGRPDIELTEPDDGASLTLAPGHTVTITLTSNPTTGFEWKVAELDEAILEQVGKAAYESSDPGGTRAGAGGKTTFRFKAVKNGETALKLIYHRPWEKDVAPAKSFYLEATVR